MLLFLLACGVASREECRDLEPLPVEYHQAFLEAVACTGLHGDLPTFRAVASRPCSDDPRKSCLACRDLGAAYERECATIAVQAGAPAEIVEHESIHHLLDVNGTPEHDHCHPAFVACDPILPRPDCGRAT